MKLIVFYFLLLFSTIAAAQSTPLNDNNDNSVTTAQNTGDSLSITDKLADLESRLNTAEQVVAEKIEARQVPTLLAKIPVTAENLTAKEQALNAVENNMTNVRTSLEQSKTLREQFREAQTQLAEENAQLEKHYTHVAELIEGLQNVKQLLDNPANQAAVSAVQKNRIPTLLSRAETLQQRYVDWGKMLTDDETAANQADTLLTTWVNVQSKYLAKQNKDNADNEKNRLIEEKNTYEKQADNLQQQLDSEQGILSTTQQLALQQQIDQARTQAWFSNVDIRLLAIMKSGRDIRQALEQQESLSITELETTETQSDTLLAQLKALQSEVEDRFTTFQKRTEITGTQADTDTQFTERMKLIAYQQLQFGTLPKQLGGLLAEKKQNNLLVKRAWLNTETWGNSQANWIKSFVQIAYQVKISAETFYQAVLAQPLLSGLLALGSLLAIWGALRAIRLVENNALEEENSYDKGFFTTLRKVAAASGVLRYPLAVAVFILVLVRFSDLSSPSDNIIRLVIYSLTIWCIGWVLLHREIKSRNLPKKIGYQSAFVLFGLVLFVLLYGLSWFSGVDGNITVLYEKALMIAMIAATLMFYRLFKHYLPKQQAIENKYLILLQKALTILPWAVIAMCGLNLFGYSRLSWFLLGYLGVIVLFAVVVGVGFVAVNQGRKRAKLWSIKHLKHGAFVAQDIVSPLSLILKLVWLYVAVSVLFGLFGWDSNSYVIAKFLNMMQYPLMTFGETAVTLQTLVLSVIAIYLIFRVARWLKRFSYHWLFAKVSDLGVRNSLSIFSQYIIVLAGVLMTLKLLGIDLTSFAVFAGALGVGIGLGLQDIAKNFISGILLLIERPLRSGDWVILDGSEGYVKSIGMRAITMETFDNQEVIIPNGNAINNSFTNYTHSSSVTRTIVYVGAGYSCEPKKVLAVLEDVIRNIEAVLSSPAPRIIMWEYADSCINYRVQYCIDVEKHHIWDTKTEVLSAIWYAFQANDIEIPFPQRDINFRNGLTMTSVDTEE